MPEHRLARTRASTDAIDLEVYRAEVRLATMHTYQTMTLEEAVERLREWIDARSAQYAYSQMRPDNRSHDGQDRHPRRDG